MKIKDNGFTAKDHSFAICAYQESPYLEECICSLLKQTVRSNIYISTSTPNEHIKALALEYSLPVFENTGEKGIAGDWNFAIACANTQLVTLAHQDDIYEPSYVEEMLSRLNRETNPILYASNYSELRGEKKLMGGRLLAVKQLLIQPMRLFPGSQVARRFSLSFGNCICCPSVTYVTEIISASPFSSEMKSNLDWQKWEEMSCIPGSFVYSPKRLMCHRIHSGAETSRIISNHARGSEDYAMFQKFWPTWAAKILTRIYSGSEMSYR